MKVDLNNSEEIIKTIYNQELQKAPFLKEYFKNGGELIEVRPSVPVRPAGRTNMGSHGIPQFKVEGPIQPQEIFRAR